MSTATEPEKEAADPKEIANELVRSGPREAAAKLKNFPPEAFAKALETLNSELRTDILRAMNEHDRQAILTACDPTQRETWRVNISYSPGTIGSMMDTPIGVFRPETTIAEAVEKLRDLVRKAFITYLFVTDENNKLLGVVTMRELLLGEREQKLADIMIKNPFALRPDVELTDAMKEVLNRHFPVYPVTDTNDTLLGLVRGQTMFEAQAVEISAQAGSMVGIEKEERTSTPLYRSFLFRHPWLQLNLLTAFVAAAVVGVFEGTIERIVALAVFLPVMAGQSGNTGCQTLAVTLRGLTLDEIKKGKEKLIVIKEGLLGLLNGALVGITAGIGMFIYAKLTNQGDIAGMLALTVLLGLVGSCVISGISGVLIPLVLRKFGADPATASSIFLTTATDVASMGIFLGLATLLIPG